MDTAAPACRTAYARARFFFCVGRHGTAMCSYSSTPSSLCVTVAVNVALVVAFVATTCAQWWEDEAEVGRFVLA